MKLEKFTKKSGKAIAKDYLNIVKFSKAFRILLMAVVLSVAYYTGRGLLSTKVIIAYCVAILCLNYLVRQKQMKTYSSLPYILTEMLDAEKYLDVCLELAQNIKHSTGMSALNLANAYYWNGDFDSAKKVLDNAVIKGTKQTEFILSCQYDVVNFNIMAKKGNTDECARLIAAMEKRISENQNNQRLSIILNDFLTNMKMGNLIARQEYEEYITLESGTGKAPSTLVHVNRQFNLALCYVALGSSNMAVTCLENTLSVPGNLFIQKQAKEMLNNLKGVK